MCVSVRVNTKVFLRAHAASLQACSLFVFVNESLCFNKKIKKRNWNTASSPKIGLILPRYTRRQSRSALRTLLSSIVFFFNNRAVGVAESHLKHPHKDHVRQSALWFRAGGDMWHTSKCLLSTPCYSQLPKTPLCCLLLMDVGRTSKLTISVHGKLSQQRVVAPLGQFLAVPNQKLLSWLKRFDCIKVDLRTILAGN